MKRKLMVSLAASAALMIAAAGCSNDGGGGTDAAFPSKDLTLIVQAAAGGGSDLSSRALATALEPILGKSIVVENRPGASGSTAMLYVKDQPADGYTIGFGPVEIAMLGSMNYDIKPSDFDLLGQIMLGPGALSVPADSPYNTLADFVEAAKTKPMTVANSGAGSIWELGALILADQTGAQVTPVPFDGGAPAVGAVLGNQVDAAVSGVNEVKQNLADGKLKVLALFHSERHPEMPDVPTAKEQGVEVEVGGWGGIYAPKGLPDDVKKTLEDGIAKAVQEDSYQEVITSSGNLVVYRNAQEFAEFAQSEFDRFAEIIGQK
ncbi:MAG: tripartite tricarboxylate transporter substrate binding protein [Propionicimonas sp.]